MKLKIVLIVLGFLIGVGVTFLASPIIERARERRIVKEAISEYGLPRLPEEASVQYAYHQDEFLMEWYGFEFQTTSAQAKIWIAKADERMSDGKTRNHPADVKYIRRVFHNVADLEEAILEYIEIHNENPKPFIWTVKASDILEKVKRAKSSLLIHNLLSGLH